MLVGSLSVSLSLRLSWHVVVIVSLLNAVCVYRVFPSLFILILMF